MLKLAVRIDCLCQISGSYLFNLTQNSFKSDLVHDSETFMSTFVLIHCLSYSIVVHKDNPASQRYTAEKGRRIFKTLSDTIIILTLYPNSILLIY